MSATTREIMQFYLEQGVLISPTLVEQLESLTIPFKTTFTVITAEVLDIINNKIPITQDDFEQSIVLKEKYLNTKLYDRFVEYIQAQKTVQSKRQDIPLKLPIEPAAPQTTATIANSSIAPLAHTIVEHETIPQSDAVMMNSTELKTYREEFMKKNQLKIVMSYDEKSRKRTVQDFVNYYTVRFRDLERILRGRQELQNLTSIGRLVGKKDRENIAIIGAVYEKSLTKNKNIMLTIEDPTGSVRVVVSQSKEELYKLAEEVQLDEVIGVVGMYDNIIFANTILYPDIPLTKELKKSPEEGYFVVIADTQYGSKLFLEKEFKKFISWIRGESGNEAQREIAANVKYIFIPGDLVDGVGIYPNQEYDLSVIDIYDQYKGFAELIKKIPTHIPIIISPGNHDVGRISEPQPAFDDEYTRSLTVIPNVIPVGNPAIINIYAKPEQGFDGFNVLLYHGYSFPYYSEQVPAIRQKGAQKRPDLIMRYLLQRRHLAPTHASSLFIPDPKKDYLALEKVPDFFFSGHIHRASVSNYRNVTCINASCWVSQSEEQERRGLEAQPARAFIINMQTREVKVMNFLSREDQEKESGTLTPPAEDLAEGAHG